MRNAGDWMAWFRWREWAWVERKVLSTYKWGVEEYVDQLGSLTFSSPHEYGRLVLMIVLQKRPSFKFTNAGAKRNGVRRQEWASGGPDAGPPTALRPSKSSFASKISRYRNGKWFSVRGQNRCDFPPPASVVSKGRILVGNAASFRCICTHGNCISPSAHVGFRSRSGRKFDFVFCFGGEGEQKCYLIQL